MKMILSYDSQSNSCAVDAVVRKQEMPLRTDCPTMRKPVRLRFVCRTGVTKSSTLWTHLSSLFLIRRITPKKNDFAVNSEKRNN